MARLTSRALPSLGRAEQAVLDYLWDHAPASAEACREALRTAWPMKESTMRTVLHRLEEKGYLRHTVEGRTYVYETTEPPSRVAARAVKQLIDRFCGGSAEELVVGMVDHAVLDAKQLERLAKKIAQRKEQSK